MASQPDPRRLLDLAVGVLRGAGYGFLTTVDGDGRPASRLVQPLDVDGDGALRVGTSPRSRKAHHVAAQPVATYACEDRDGYGYVAVRGPVVIRRDEELRRSVWREELELFFPEGPDGDDFVVLQLDPERIEVVHFVEGVHPEPHGLVPAVLERDGGAWRTRDAERAEEPADG